MLQRWLHSSLVCLFLLFQFPSLANERNNLEVPTELPMGHWTISPDSKCAPSSVYQPFLALNYSTIGKKGTS